MATCELCGGPTTSKYGVCKRTSECKREGNRRRTREWKAAHPDHHRGYYEANREAVLAQQHAYRAANLESVRGRERERMRSSRAADPEAARKAYRRQYAANPEARREANRKWRKAADPEILRQASKAYYEANREQVLERGRQWHNENREYCAAQAGLYHAENRDDIRERKRAYYEANREAESERNRRYRETNLDIVRERGREANRKRLQRTDRPCRYAKSAGCEEFAIVNGNACRQHMKADSARRNARKQEKVRRSLASNQGWVCTWCACLLPEDLGATHVDHIIPVARGGPEDEWNLQLLHDVCNMSKQDKITPLALALAAEHGIALAAAA
jgi:5-methylcytosine-specific restriction endonuclease McrA